MRDLSNTHWFLLCELGIKLPLGISFMTLLYLMRNMVNSQVIVMFGTISLELYLIHIWLVKYIVKDSVFQGLALIIVSALLAYSFNKMCNYCTNLLVADKRNDNAIDYKSIYLVITPFFPSAAVISWSLRVMIK